MKIPNIYAKPYYKYYILISLVIGIAALMLLPGLKQGIDLRGGTSITVNLEQEVDTAAVESFLAESGLEDISVRYIENPVTKAKGMIIEFTGHADLLRAEEIAESDPAGAIEIAKPFIGSLESIEPNATAALYLQLARDDLNAGMQEDLQGILKVGQENIGIREVGSSLGQQFWDTSLRALIFAFVMIAIIVFILFREPIPSIAVIQAAAYDILIALAGMALFDIPLTLPTIAALLMILGHSVDTDILTTDRVLKRREGTPAERAHGAMITGLTITGTMLIVLFVLVTFSYFNQMTTIFQIAAVLMFGLLGDLPSSWCTNTVMIKWWAEKKNL